MDKNFTSERTVNRTIAIVLLCHFISAASTLGIAPFFSLILSSGFQQKPSLLIGFLYILPTLLTGLFSPMWGKIADKINKKSALLRAQFGLALSFLVAAYSIDHLWLFILSLCAQGILGGTLAAANAYLARIPSKVSLATLLNLTQFSARAAFLCAPILIGLLITFTSVFSVYFLLASITAISVIMVALFLPNDQKQGKEKNRPEPVVHKAPISYLNSDTNHLSYSLLLIGNFVLSMSLVATFPYFILMIDQIFEIKAGMFSGFLFGLPHGMFLILLFFLQNKLMMSSRQIWLFSFSLIVLSLSIIAQVITSNITLLILMRCLMGASMTFSYISLNTMIARIKFQKNEGAIFGWLDSFNKYGGVTAGLLAGILFSFYGAKSPFIFSSVSLICFSFIIISLNFKKLIITRGRHNETYT